MKDRRLPPITPLQFLVLGTLRSSERAGRMIRDTIAAYGVRSSAPAFYQMMARLERDGLIEGWYGQIKVGDQAVTERRYRIQPAGAKLWTETRAFYETVAASSAEEGWSNA
jgi:DNA-binding PadR family transcriptional regulator